MKIACLGWGSLIWNPGSLPIQRQWFHDGPMVKVEFTRKSSDGRITLALTPDVTSVRSLWAVMDSEEMEIAKESLRAREKVNYKKYPNGIGTWKIGEPNPEMISGLAEWVASKSIGGVIWTALSPEFDDIKNIPSEEQIVEYLQSRTGRERESAKEYVERAPEQIDTSYRRRIEAMLGWVPK